MTMPDLPAELAGALAMSVPSSVKPPEERFNKDISIDSVSLGEVLPTRKLVLRSQLLSDQGKKYMGDLCDDVWNRILDYLSGRPWLYKVLQLSKRFYKLVLPRLYKSISFHLDFPNRDLTSALFDVDNPGLQYIRKLSLTLSSTMPVVASDLMASMFVSLLPRDILRYFFWNGVMFLLDSTCRNLWERQRNLVNIEILSDAGFIRVYVPTSLKSLTHLRLMPNHTSHLKAGAIILRHTMTINTLILDLRCKEQDEQINEDDDGPFTSCSVATKEFFAPPTGTRFSLTKLELCHANLHETTHAIISALSLPSLKDLCLHRCKGADIFLCHLSQLKDPPQLHSLRINHLEPAVPDTIVSAIEDYLVCTPSSLVTLTIILRGYIVQPKASSIVHHGSTLQHLFLDVRSHTYRTFDDCDNAALYPSSELQTFFLNLPHLTQLAMAFPKVVADGGHLIERDIDFNIQNDGVHYLPSLVTLNITTYPYPIGTPTESNDPFNNCGPPSSVLPAAHQALLTHLANVILERSRDYNRAHHQRESPLRTVVFGIAEKGHRRSMLKRVKTLRPAYFTRSDVWEWRKGVREDMKLVLLRWLEMEGEEVNVLMERVDERVVREEMLFWSSWWERVVQVD